MSTASNRELDLYSEQTALHDYHVSMLFLNQHNSSILFYRKEERNIYISLKIITVNGYLFGTGLRSH